MDFFNDWEYFYVMKNYNFYYQLDKGILQDERICIPMGCSTTDGTNQNISLDGKVTHQCMLQFLEYFSRPPKRYLCDHQRNALETPQLAPVIGCLKPKFDHTGRTRNTSRLSLNWKPTNTIMASIVHYPCLERVGSDPGHMRQFGTLQKVPRSQTSMCAGFTFNTQNELVNTLMHQID